MLLLNVTDLTGAEARHLSKTCGAWSSNRFIIDESIAEHS